MMDRYFIYSDIFTISYYTQYLFSIYYKRFKIILKLIIIHLMKKKSIFDVYLCPSFTTLLSNAANNKYMHKVQNKLIFTFLGYIKNVYL